MILELVGFYNKYHNLSIEIQAMVTQVMSECLSEGETEPTLFIIKMIV